MSDFWKRLPDLVRLPLLSRLLAGAYFVWSCLVYFGSMAGDHEWWPAFLYQLIWPISWAYEAVGETAFEAIWPVPSRAQYLVYDGLSGAFYIVAGTLWWALVGLVLTVVARRIRSRGSLPA
jgi:hypothetical protein